eukprot:scaffold16878_cov49-Attheya_sp.AAC.2
MTGPSLQSIRLVLHREGIIELGPANIMISLKEHASAEHGCSMVAAWLQHGCNAVIACSLPFFDRELVLDKLSELMSLVQNACTRMDPSCCLNIITRC